VLERHVGFDVAFFCGENGFGEASLGLDPAVRSAAGERWAEMSVECLELLVPARRSGGVIVDSDWFGFGPRLTRLVYYDTLMRPHRGRTTLIAFLECRGVLLGELVLGRSRGSTAFSAAHVQALRWLAPVLSVSRYGYRDESPESSACGSPKRPALGAARGDRGRCVAGLGLTPREREVLGYLHLGYTNEQIAHALGSAARTVRNQLSRVYEKLGVGTRAEAVAWCLSDSAPERPSSARAARSRAPAGRKDG
jgi:DNA-binding CsgD family transcriptional regulator